VGAVAVIVGLGGWTMSSGSPAGSASSPAVAARSVPTSAAINGELNGVSCVSATDCFAVGYSLVGPNGRLPIKTLVERWDGKSWSTVPSPSPNGGYLSAVSCTSAINCVAVGSTIAATGLTASVLVERWNGKIWSIVASPNPNGDTDRQLAAVSCTRATFCFAVGFSSHTSSSDLSTLVERWNGTTMSIVKTPIISNWTGVSCTSTTACVSVDFEGRAALWNGKYWANRPTPQPSDPGFEAFALDSVSCVSATACFAVGTDAVPVGSFYTLVERWNGKTWSGVPSPGGSTDIFSAVSCATRTACVAVGDHDTSGGFGSQPNPMSEHWNGTAWSVITTPKPNGTYGLLGGVTCTSPTNCFAVGESQPLLPGPNESLGPATTLIEQWNGTTWTIVPSP
jgi:hypothetical protein